MRVLYVTGLFSGLRDLLLEGRSEAAGMPALVRPLRALLEAGHEVDFVIGVSPEDVRRPLRPGPEWLWGCGFQVVPWRTTRLAGLASAWRMYRATLRALRGKRYDFVYGHGPAGTVATLAARHRRVPCGARLYGSFLIEEIDRRSRLSIFLRHPLEYLAFRLPKRFLLVTNDGTRADQVQQRLAPRGKCPYDFHFLLNGVQLPSNDEQAAGGSAAAPASLPEGPFLFYPARLARWKRQHLAVEILERLYRGGQDKVRLCFAGHLTQPEYWEEIQAEAAARGLAEQVMHLGALGPNEMLWCYRHALAVLSFYQTSNLGNVVIEALAAGAVVLAARDGSLEGIIEDGMTGLLARDAEEAAEKLAWLREHPEAAREIGECAARQARETFRSWEERSAMEVALIERAVAAPRMD